MRTTLHIFKKDVRRLWHEILVVLALTALFAWIEPKTTHDLSAGLQNGLDLIGTILRMLLPVAWWYLIALAIHQEAIPGDRQYWLTRPIAWRHLLGSKLLLILAFINLPLAACDCLILAASGFNPAHHLSGLLTKQLLFTAIYLAPAVMLALVTNTLSQMILWCLGVAIFIMGASTLPLPHAPGEGAGWIIASACSTVFLIAVLALLFIQYRCRGTRPARALVACVAAVVLLLPYSAKLQRFVPRPIDTSGVRATLDRNVPLHSPAPREAGSVPIQFDIQLDGVPAGMEVACDLLDAGAHDAEDGFWSFGRMPGNSVYSRHGRIHATVLVPRRVFNQLEDRALTFDTSLDLTLVRVQATGHFPARASWTQVQGIGSCNAQPSVNFGDTNVACRFPFRPPRMSRSAS